MKQPRDQIRWVRLSREQRDHLYAFTDGSVEDEIVAQWDSAPDDDGLIRGLILVGSGTLVALPIAIVVLIVAWWLS